MEHGILGRSGLKVSRLGFGGAPAGLKNYIDEYDPADVAARIPLETIHQLFLDR